MYESFLLHEVMREFGVPFMVNWNRVAWGIARESSIIYFLATTFPISAMERRDLLCFKKTGCARGLPLAAAHEVSEAAICTHKIQNRDYFSTVVI